MQYTRVRLPKDASPERASFTLDLVKFSKIASSLTSSAWCYEDRDSVHFKPHRYDVMTAKIKANNYITMPVVYIMNGIPAIYEGEHRCYALLDLGYTSVQVCCPKEDYAVLMDLVGIPTVTQRILSRIGLGRRQPASIEAVEARPAQQRINSL